MKTFYLKQKLLILKIIIANEKCCSFTQIRGSVPLLWEQPGLNVGSHKVKISLDRNISQSVYDKFVNYT